MFSAFRTPGTIAFLFDATLNRSEKITCVKTQKHVDFSDFSLEIDFSNAYRTAIQFCSIVHVMDLSYRRNPALIAYGVCLAVAENRMLVHYFVSMYPDVCCFCCDVSKFIRSIVGLNRLSHFNLIPC